MKNYFYIYIIGLAGFFILLTSEVAYHTGSPGGKTGSPGDGGATCTECHGGTATFKEGWISSDIPAEGYMPGETYTITATGTHEGVVRFGFELTSEDASSQKTGTLQVTNASETQLANANKSITHTSNGFTPTGNSKIWTFDWIAPDEGTGEVTFYAAFNAANGNGGSSGDIIYRSSYSVQESVTSSIGKVENNDDRLQVFPNPVRESFTLAYDDQVVGIENVKLFNGTGILVDSYENRDITNKSKISLNDYTAGIYFLVVKLNSGTTVSKRIVKL